MGFPRQEYWSELPFPFPGNFPDPETRAASPALTGGFFTTEPLEKPALKGHHLHLFPVLCKNRLSYVNC